MPTSLPLHRCRRTMHFSCSGNGAHAALDAVGIELDATIVQEPFETALAMLDRLALRLVLPFCGLYPDAKRAPLVAIVRDRLMQMEREFAAARAPQTERGEGGKPQTPARLPPTSPPATGRQSSCRAPR
jgi:hypothetical protein